MEKEFDTSPVFLFHRRLEQMSLASNRCDVIG